MKHSQRVAQAQQRATVKREKQAKERARHDRIRDLRTKELERQRAEFRAFDEMARQVPVGTTFQNGESLHVLLDVVEPESVFDRLLWKMLENFPTVRITITSPQYYLSPAKYAPKWVMLDENCKPIKKPK